MPPSGLLISCATPAASFPTDASFSEFLICCSSFLVSVMSRAMPSTPKMSPSTPCSGDTLTITDRGSPALRQHFDFIDLLDADIQGDFNAGLDAVWTAEAR